MYIFLKKAKKIAVNKSYSFRSVAPKENGNNSFIAIVLISPFTFDKYMFTFASKNSLITWRHDPQGGTGLLVSATTAIESNSRSPAAIALNIATLSAQQVTGYAAFSILHPV